MSDVKLNEKQVSHLVDFFMDDIKSYIDDEWDAGEYGEKMTRKEAAAYLGHSVKDMSKEEIDEEVSFIQKTYYTESGSAGASDQEIVELFLKMII